MSEIIIFDRKLKRRHRDRAAQHLPGHFLIREAEERLLGHLEGITREFPLALCMGSPLPLWEGGGGGVSLENNCPPHQPLSLPSPTRGEGSQIPAKKIIRADSSLKMHPDIILDEEFIPFAENSFDLVLSLLNLHWVNDLPGALIQIRRILKKDGLFVASLFAGETLHELRRAGLEAEMAGGVSPRISPFPDIKSAAALLQRAGFSMPVVDSEKITVLYPDIFPLIKDLRAMGETNALVKRRKNFTSSRELAAIGEKYRELFADPEGMIPATFEIFTLTGSA